MTKECGDKINKLTKDKKQVSRDICFFSIYNIKDGSGYMDKYQRERLGERTIHKTSG